MSYHKTTIFDLRHEPVVQPVSSGLFDRFNNRYQDYCYAFFFVLV